MTKKSIPLWKYSAIHGLNFDDIYGAVDEISNFEWEYPHGERTEDFHVFFVDVSARAERLLEQLYECREYFYEDSGEDGFRGWNDFCVALLGGHKRVIGWDASELDYYGMFARGFGCFGEDEAVKAATERMERFTKRELIERWHKVAVVLVSYLELRAAYDGLSAALDYLENDGVTKAEELTRDIEVAYNRLWVYDKYANAYYPESAMVAPFEKAFEKSTPEMWVY